MRETLEAGIKRCYACIQWDGIREYNAQKKVIIVDKHLEANCMAHHKKMRGNATCDLFFPLR